MKALTDNPGCPYPGNPGSGHGAYSGNIYDPCTDLTYFGSELSVTWRKHHNKSEGL